jgi:cytochrome c peroxidase
MRTTCARWSARLVMGCLGAILGAGGAAAQVPSLSSIPVPRPANLGEFIRDEQAAKVLGKALFWDMQVGSDGVQACGTCHFRAGADPRSKNQVSPGLLRFVFTKDASGKAIAVPDPDVGFEGQGPNDTLQPSDFPFRTLNTSTNRDSGIMKDSNNVVSSQGVHFALHGVTGSPGPDPENFRVGGANVRRVEPRNTPTMINAVFNHRNFWDMRAQNIFNGVNPFGDRDPNAFVYSVSGPSSLQKTRVQLENSSLASQAVGPPTNRFEMSADGRPFPNVGRNLTLEIAQGHRETAKKLKTVVPLGKQKVDPDDSLLGPLSRPQKGLNTDYESLIRKAFQPRWWDSNLLVRVAGDGTTAVVPPAGGSPRPDEFTLIEYNFSLFFGLAVQAYESTLVADDTPFDRFLKNPTGSPLSPEAERGRQIFFNVNQAPAPRGNCLFCHSGALLSEASVVSAGANMIRTVQPAGDPSLPKQLSDTGTRNIGVRETTADLGNGGLDPFGTSLSVAASNLPAGSVLAADGTFKIPGLRNVELTAPYFHNGGELTLHDVVNFYARGGNQGGATNPIKTRDGTVIGGLAVLNFNTPDAEAVKNDLVEFLKSLTDERVRKAAAPFDHPEIFVPEGHPGDSTSVKQKDGQAVDELRTITATGREGRRDRN